MSTFHKALSADLANLQSLAAFILKSPIRSRRSSSEKGTIDGEQRKDGLKHHRGLLRPQLH